MFPNEKIIPSGACLRSSNFYTSFNRAWKVEVHLEIWLSLELKVQKIIGVSFLLSLHPMILQATRESHRSNFFFFVWWLNCAWVQRRELIRVIKSICSNCNANAIKYTVVHGNITWYKLHRHVPSLDVGRLHLSRSLFCLMRQFIPGNSCSEYSYRQLELVWFEL